METKISLKQSTFDKILVLADEKGVSPQELILEAVSQLT
jgi:hypothetical protein